MSRSSLRLIVINPHVPWMRDAKATGRSTEDSWGVEFFEPVAPRDGEFIVRKRAVSAFAGTELDRLLRVRDIFTLGRRQHHELRRGRNGPGRFRPRLSSADPRGLLRERVRRVAGLLDDADTPDDR